MRSRWPRSGRLCWGRMWMRIRPVTRRAWRLLAGVARTSGSPRVPEARAAKTRMHFDLRAPGPVQAELARLEQLGASVLERHEHHTVMQDPEGNEFCVEPGPARQHTQG